MFIFVFSLFISVSWACETTFDQLQIPHVKFKTEEEYYYCFGFHHGRDRAWQMDYFRRVAQGRNAEVLGFSQLKTDLMMRLVDLPSLAQKIYASIPEEKWNQLKHYSKGVNEGFKTGKEAKELKEMGLVPEEWKPIDSILVLLLQSFDQTRKTFTHEYDEEKFKETWKEKSEELFNEDDLPWEDPILKSGEYPLRETAQKNPPIPSKSVQLWAQFPTVFGEQSGSNNWVVSSKFSKLGYAFLANDPHLDLKTPLFWYWIKFKSNEKTYLGGSLPGVPVIINGTNGKVAWGLTNSYLNSADAAFIKDTKSEDVESMRPLVWIKFGPLKLPFFFKSFNRFKLGWPVLPLETEHDGVLAMRWYGYGLKGEDLLPMFELRDANNVEEMNGVLSRINVGSWNYVFADSQGDIGYRVVGRTYKIHSKLSYGLPHLTKEEFAKEEFLSPEERPHALKPERGYVYTANQRHWPKDAKFYGGRAYSAGFRGQRINQMLQTHRDPESSKKIQCDIRANDAVYFVPKLLEIIEDETLKSWDFMATPDSKAAPLYRRLMSIILKEWNVNEPALWHLMAKLTDKQKKEIQVFHRMAKKDINGRAWKDVQYLGFDHLSKNEDWVFSKPVGGIGDYFTVNPGSNKWDSEKKIFEHFSGTSVRVIIELMKTPRIQIVLPGKNRNYTEADGTYPWEDWALCRYHTIDF